MRTDTSSDSTHRSRSNRVPRACDRCRIRKIKCNGKNQCSRCSVDDAICIYTKRRRPNDRAYSKEYVQLLEEQQNMLVKGMKELYRRNNAGEALPDLPSTANDQMLIHEVLAQLGVLTDERDSMDDYESVNDDFAPTLSSRASICSGSYFSDHHSALDVSPMTTSPTSRSESQSPALPHPQLNFDNLHMKIDAHHFSSLPPQDPTPKAVDYTFSEAFRDIYLFGDDYSKGTMDGFVNPCDTTFTTSTQFSNPFSV